MAALNFNASEVLQIIIRTPEAFQGSGCTVLLSSGHTVNGKIDSASGSSGGGLVLKSQNDSISFINGKSICGLTFEGLNDQQMEILSAGTYDPLLNKEIPGNLELKRLASGLSLPLNWSVALSREGNEDEISRKVFLQLLETFKSVVNEMAKDKFGREQMEGACTEVMLKIGDTASVTLKDGTLVIESGTLLDQRFTETVLADKINAIF